MPELPVFHQVETEFLNFNEGVPGFLSQLPDDLTRQIEQALRSIGEHAAIKSVQKVFGGCINNGACLTTENETKYFLKWNLRSPAGLFSAEEYGLNLIASTHTIRAPSVLSVFDPPAISSESSLYSDHPGFILLEWIQSPHSSSKMGNPAVLGEQLADLHRSSSKQAFGLDYPNYLGSTRQINTWKRNWTDFFRENRLGVQYKLADQNHLLSSFRQRSLEKTDGQPGALVRQ